MKDYLNDMFENGELTKTEIEYIWGATKKDSHGIDTELSPKQICYKNNEKETGIYFTNKNNDHFFVTKRKDPNVATKVTVKMLSNGGQDLVIGDMGEEKRFMDSVFHIYNTCFSNKNFEEPIYPIHTEETLEELYSDLAFMDEKLSKDLQERYGHIPSASYGYNVDSKLIKKTNYTCFDSDSVALGVAMKKAAYEARVQETSSKTR